MSLFQIDIDNKTLIIFITSFIWVLNFRTTFKNINKHMDSGSYASLKFDPYIILIKNILCCFFFIGFYCERRINKPKNKIEKKLIKMTQGSMVIFEVKSTRLKTNHFFGSILLSHQLIKSKEKIMFCIKILLIIFIIYFIEELYFIIANNHILDRLICPIRNLGTLITLLICSSLLAKKYSGLYRHQSIPLIIIFIFSIFIILFNKINIDRFEKIFKLNFLYYLILFILMGIEMVLLKYLVDTEYISMYFILGIKGIIGTVVFTIINIFFTKSDFFIFWDKLLNFEYDEMYEEFEMSPKIYYIITLLILQYLKIYIINRFSENHLISVIMITDIIYFPFYCFERFYIQDFQIATYSTFYINIILGFINTFLMLIFNEILECKFWGLNTNLKKNINIRQEQELINNPVNRDTCYSENE